MKKHLRVSGVVLALLTITACGPGPTREDKVSTMIDQVKSPFIVMNSNPKSLIDKSGAMEGALPFTQEMLIGFFMDEETTGVDNSVDVQIVLGKSGGFVPEGYGIFKIKDEALFIELLETEANAKVKEKEGLKYVIKDNDEYVLVWNEEFAVAGNMTYKLTDVFNNSGDPGMKAVNRIVKMINAVDENEVNEKYRDFLSEESDISILFQGQGLYSYLSEASMGQSEEVEENKESITGVSSTMFIDFNDGSIDMRMSNQLSEKLAAELAFLMSDPVGQDLMAYGNSKNPMMMMGTNINVAEGLDFVKDKMGLDEYEEVMSELEELGIDVETFKSALSGEFLIVMDRIEVVEREIDWGYGDPYITQEPMPIFGMVMGVEDRETMKSIFPDSLGFDGVVSHKGAYMVLMDNVFFSSSDSMWAARVASGSTAHMEDPQSVFNTRPIGMYLDFLRFDHLEEMKEVRPLINMMEYMKFEASALEMDFSLVFKDKSTNSLRILTETISGLMEGEKGAGYKEIEAELEAAAAEEAAVADGE